MADVSGHYHSDQLEQYKDQHTFVAAFFQIPKSLPVQGRLFDPSLLNREGKQSKTLSYLGSQAVSECAALTFSSNTFILDALSIKGYNVATDRQLEYLVVLGTSEKTKSFWKMLRKVVMTATDHFSAAQLLITTVKKNRTAYFENKEHLAGEWGIELQQRIFNNQSFLSDRFRFETIKALFSLHHFVYRTLNIYNVETMRCLSKSIQQLGLQFDLVYFSNIMADAKEQGLLSLFRASMMELANVMSRHPSIIYATPMDNGSLEQKVVHNLPELLNEQQTAMTSFSPMEEKSAERTPLSTVIRVKIQPSLLAQLGIANPQPIPLPHPE